MCDECVSGDRDSQVFEALFTPGRVEGVKLIAIRVEPSPRPQPRSRRPQPKPNRASRRRQMRKVRDKL